MDKQVKNILQDLYAIDSNLEQYEDELIKIISQLLVSRPDTRFDKKFARRLRAELLRTKKVKIQGENFIINPVKFVSQLFNRVKLKDMLNTKQFVYTGAGITLILVAVVIWQGGLLGPDETRFAFAPRVTKLEDRAFGSLIEVASQSQSDSITVKSESATTPLAAGLGGGGGFVRTQSGGGGDYIVMPVPDAVRLNYVYQGENFSFNEGTVKVLRRVKGDQLARGLADKIKGINLGGFNFSQFSNLSLESINFNEEKDYGYNISISPKEGVFSLGQNWMRWPHPEQDCNGDQRCYENLRLTPQDVPADEVLIKIANDFMAEIGIDRSGYGKPEVNQSFRGPEVQYIGESVQVVYPLLIGEQEIFEESGGKVGMNVSINIRYNRVDGLWNYRTEEYESSGYEAETDMDRVLKFAKQGGRYPHYGWDQAEKTADIILGTPSIGYVRIWKYESNQSTELLVPAYIFPVIEKPDNAYVYFDSVSVPLAKELLDQSEREWNNIIPELMPLLEEKNIR